MLRCKRKFLTWLLVFTLIMTMVPAQVFAQDSSSITQLNNITSQGATASQIYIGEGFEAEFNVLDQWDSNFTGEIKVTNTGTETIENWMLTFNFGQAITSIWNAEITLHENNKYIIKNLGWNQDIAIGETITIGFNGTWKDQISEPTDYKILGIRKRVQVTDYTVEFNVTNNWEEAFTGEIVLTNTGEKPIEDWILEFDFDRNIQQFWTADIIEHEGIHYIRV